MPLKFSQFFEPTQLDEADEMASGGVKHLTHIEDAILLNGSAGIKLATDYMQKVVDSMSSNDASYCVTTKFDGCVHPDSMLMTEMGLKKITDVEVGETVLGFNFENKKSEFTYVYNTHTNSNGDKKWVEICFEDGTNIKVTEDHEIHTKNRGWVEARNLSLNDDIDDIEGVISPT